MDIESDSDISERWEDFFGSSTELAPSLLGIYDTLTSTLPGNHSRSNSSNNSNSRSNNKGSHSSSSSSSQSNGNSINASSSNSRQSCYSDEEEHNQRHKHKHNHEHYDSNNVDNDEARADDEGFDVHDGAKQSHQVASPAAAATVTPSPPKQQAQYIDSARSLRASHESLGTASISSSTSSLNSRHRSNIRVLSPNVQRIITHSDAVPVDAVDIDALQQQQQHIKSPEQSPVTQTRYVKKSSPLPTGGSHRLKLSHIPLSKITGKLTQSGTELVQTFDSSNEYLNSINFTQTTDRVLKKPSSPPTPAVVHIPGVDEDKTPTNNVGSPFNFDCVLSKSRKLTLPKYESQESIKLIEMEQLASTTQLLNNAVAATPMHSTPNGKATENAPPLPMRAKEFIATEPLSPIESENTEAINFDLITQHIEQLTLWDEPKSNDNSYTSDELIEAINKPLISKPLVRSSSAACAATVTYARAKSLVNKSNTLGGPVPAKLPTAEQLAELEEANKFSAESLDRLTDIKSKFSPKETRKLTGLMLPEIAKLKHRPLSSSSICSTSSSSSSGSDQLNGKLATSYLASVESLAESENEHAGLSVFERTCLEIVDSERSYVQDLGQVIQGYLKEWREHARLRTDQLKILFSNIEEIYEFNSTLLKQLINSGMDPCKIAKCFIDLAERFDVYTTYCTSYPEAISLLTTLLQTKNTLLASTQKTLQHTLPLGSYLLKPVQRILKYHLLLDNLRKHCDVKEVQQAHEIMRQVARHIDQVKRQLDQQSRIKELSGILDGWLGPELTVLGELRQEGLLMEHSKPRLVFLFATMLIITKQKEDNRLQFKSYIHQNNLMLNEHLPGEPTSFYVIPYDEPRNQIKLTAKNRDQKRLWAQHIKGVILEKFDNIPMRARQLVYQLGDEEDRTPDRSTWKWSLHSNSNSTPVYLERRNQCRRSEIRNRSKFKRKTVTNSSSFDSFNEAVEQIAKEQANGDAGGAAKSVKTLTRNNSMDDNMLPALQKFAAAVRSRSSKRESTNAEAEKAEPTALVQEPAEDCTCAAETQHGRCLLHDRRANSSMDATKSPVFGYKALKERSKSVPRIGYNDDDLNEEDTALRGSKTNLTERKTKGKGVVEVKQYNHKTIPKRIATLKKQRMSKKETSKFYMDLSEFDCSATTTVLKITESSENLLEQQQQEANAAKQKETQLPDVVDQYCKPKTAQEQLEYEALTPVEKTKRDAQIILDLLKNNKDFERIYNKQHKRREASSTSPQSPLSPMLPELPPRPPSRSPPPLESEHEQPPLEAAKEAIEVSELEPEDEPIYETLLRNVHVPYKFSPILGRAKSTQYYKPREKKSQMSVGRPESDYVTLVYAPNGKLQQVGEEHIGRDTLQQQNFEYRRDSSDSTSSSSSSTVKRESQNTVIHVECSSQSNLSQNSSSDTNTNSTVSGALEPLYARPIPKNLMKRLLSNSSKSSLENVSNSESSLLPRALKSIDNITLSFGRSNRPPERRVSDVSEMCRQSILHRQGSEAVGERMAHVDYADPRTLFTIVGSSETSLQRDSVFSLTSSNDSVCEQQQRKRSVAGLPTNFEYEQDVEDNLENDFRDSAIYSDDNEKRADKEVKRPSSPPPPPPTMQNLPPVPPKPCSVPPTTGLMRSYVAADKDGNALPGVVLCPPHLNQSSSRSWVLQQIDNFNK